MPIADSDDPGRSCVERNGPRAMMGFRIASAAALGGGLLVAMAVAATAQQAATPQAATTRFPLGVQFEMPQGWSWRDLQFSPGSNSRSMPLGKALFHPHLQMALDWHDPKRWSAEINEYEFRLRCEICGQGSRTHMMIARMTTMFFENLDAALAMVTRAHARIHKLDLGEVRRHAMADVAIAWTEQPGSRIPFVGAVKRGTGYFFVSISAPESMTAEHDDLRNDFLAIAGSVRPWYGATARSLPF